MSYDPQAQPEKKTPVVVKVLIVLAILVGLAFLTCVGAGVWMASSEEGQKLINAAANAQTAPGTEDLRALGCTTAMVMRYGDLSGMLGSVLDDEELSSIPADTRFVICQPTTATLTCSEVAATYVAATAPDGPFSAQVQGTGQQCQAFFDAAGNEVEALE